MLWQSLHGCIFCFLSRPFFCILNDKRLMFYLICTKIYQWLLVHQAYALSLLSTISNVLRRCTRVCLNVTQASLTQVKLNGRTVEARILNLNKRELFLICVCNRFLCFCQDQLNQNRLGSEAITLPKQDLLNNAEFID